MTTMHMGMEEARGWGGISISTAAKVCRRLSTGRLTSPQSEGCYGPRVTWRLWQERLLH